MASASPRNNPNRRPHAVLRALLRWLNPIAWFRAATVASPHCGDRTPEPPHCGETDQAEPPQCGETHLDRAKRALAAFERELQQAAESPQCGESDSYPWGAAGLATLLAVEYRRRLQQHPDLIGFQIRRDCVKAHYPVLCQALGVEWPPPYKDFAAQLAGEPGKRPALMPRRRKERWERGKRVDTATWYLVPDPAAAVVELAAVKRKRA